MIISLLPPHMLSDSPTSPCQPTCEGGETELFLSRDHSHVSAATTTPGCALVFRKDLRHAGRPVLSGLSLPLCVTSQHSMALCM